MMTALNFIFLLVGVVIAIPSTVLFLETLFAFASSSTGKLVTDECQYRPIAVLVPAYNESSGIGATLESISQQLMGSDLLVVVADNCTDDTAAIASAQGAEVIVRTDLLQRGKGFALACGIAWLEQKRPRVVIVIDADCRVGPGAIEILAATCAARNHPVQALNLMKSPKGEEHRFGVAEFAWIVRNKVRPLGLANLGMPCQLMGTGMAFPWETIRTVNLASSNVVEDLELGLALARSGFPPVFCIDALVESQFPMTEEGVKMQRQRWEQGSLAMLLSNGWWTIIEAIKSRNLPLLVLALDMMVPPLALHGAAIVVFSSIAGVTYLAGVTSIFPFVVAALSGVLFGLALLISWCVFGRDVLPPSQWLRLMPYLLAKLKIYRGFSRQGPKHWVRSDRTREK